MNRRFILAGSSVLVLVLGLCSYWLWVFYHVQSTDDAYVKADSVYVNAQIEGTLEAIYATENMVVKKNQPLAQIDPSDAKVNLQQKIAALSWSVRETQKLIEQVSQSKQQFYLHQAKLEKATFDYEQRLELIDQGMISQEEFQQVKTTFDIARASLEAAKNELQIAFSLAGRGPLELHPLIQIAKQELFAAKLKLARCTILSPVDGVIAKKRADLGTRLTPSQPLFVIIPHDRIWVEANFKETQLAHLRVGQKAKITADIYGSKVLYPATIASIGSAAGNVFALLPPQNATGNWIKIVQRVPVRLLLDQEALKSHPLCLGASALVEVDLSQQDGLSLLEGSLTIPSQTSELFETTYQEIAHEVDCLLQELLQGSFASK